MFRIFLSSTYDEEFIPFLSDGCTYKWLEATTPLSFIYVVIWVDDIFWFGNGPHARIKLNRMCDVLEENKYKTHRLGDITRAGVLGVTITRDRHTRTTTLSLQTYLDTFLQSTKNEHGVPYWQAGTTARTPTAPKCKPAAPDPEHQLPPEQAKEFLSRVMTLMYAALIARPDILEPLCEVARFMKEPGAAHMHRLERIIAYINGTRNYALTYRYSAHIDRPEDMRIRVFGDASWIDEHRMGTTGGRVTYLGRNPIDWKCKLIKRVMTSTHHCTLNSISSTSAQRKQPITGTSAQNSVATTQRRAIILSCLATTKKQSKRQRVPWYAAIAGITT